MADEPTPKPRRFALLWSLLTNVCCVSAVCLIWVLASLAFSIISGKWHWFSRSGSILALGGAILTVRLLLRLGVEEFFQSSLIEDGGNASPTPEEIEALRQHRLDVQAAHIGFWFIVVGTLIWGYGDALDNSCPADICTHAKNTPAMHPYCP